MEKVKQENNSSKKIKKIRLRVILVLIFIGLLAIFSYISYRGNYLEITEIGNNFSEVFTQKLAYQYATILVNFVILFFVIYFANRGIKKGLKAFFEEEKKEMPKLPNKSIAFILAAIISIIVSYILTEQVQLFVNRAFFGIYDPVFGADLGFYIFEKPFIQMVILYLIGIIIGITIYATLYYIIIFNKYFDGINAQTLKKSKFFKQITRNAVLISILIAAYILVNTQGIIIDRFLILNDDTSTSIHGAGITDISIKLWGYRIFAILIVLAVCMAIHFFKKKETKKVVTAILSIPAYLVLLFILMTGFKVIYINQNELDKEKAYIQSNIDYTKTAYNIKIEEVNIETEEIQNIEEIKAHSELINMLPIVPEEVTLKTLDITQTSTGYYSFRNTNINRYLIDGKEKLVYLSPREIISSGNRTYNNKTYEYTHGFGAVITSATETDELGNISYIQKDFGATNNAINITQPRIYFGLETNNTIVTNSQTKSEFDYPTNTSQNVEYTYDGKAGLSLNFIDRIILAIKEGDINLALSSNVTEKSKILINRNIIERAKTILPNVIYDEEPYMVVSDDGRLVWVLDAYTVTNQYPYSQPIVIEHDGVKEEINYIRNSLKVLIDAYDGEMKFYITDTLDPIIMAYNNMYDNLFEEEPIPEDIVKHFVYPKFLYNIQAEILQRYHDVSPDVLYRGDDVWEIAKYAKTTQTSAKGTKQEPYYTMLKTVDSDKLELGLVTSFTQLNKQSLRSYLVGKCDSKGNSTLVLYKFSQDANILGPMQLQVLLEEDATISKEIESINSTGTRILKTMIAVPINNTILYVQPIYQELLNGNKNIPTLKKVIVACGNKVAIDDDLGSAIKELLSQSAVNIEVENTDTIEDLIVEIIKANNNLNGSSNNNDWEMMGKDIKKLQELIDKLEQLKDKQDKLEAEQKNKNTISSSTIN